MQSASVLHRPPPPRENLNASGTPLPTHDFDYKGPVETVEDPDDDNVPLAKGIPTALQAQKSIRISARASRASQRRNLKLKTLSAPAPPHADAHNTKHPKPPSPGLPPEELMQKLMELQTNGEAPTRGKSPTNQHQLSGAAGSAFTTVVAIPTKHRGDSDARSTTAPRVPHAAIKSKNQTSNSIQLEHPASVLNTAQLTPFGGGPPIMVPQRPPEPSSRTVSRSNTVHRQVRRTSDEAPRTPSDDITNREVAVRAFLRSTNSRSEESFHDKRGATHPAGTLKQDISPVQPYQSVLPQPEILLTVDVYIFNLQTSVKLDIDASTTAQSALNTLMRQHGETFEGASGSNDITLWELANDFGMERPVRQFELLRKVCDAWDMQRPVNAFIVKHWGLSSLLTRKAALTAPPTAQSDVQWQAKRGKWTKRHLHLHDGNFYLSKVGKGKEEPFLCSVTNHDFYLVTRIHKAPKPFIFAIKSTDNIVFYENPDESLHVFAVGQVEGERWMEQIVLARSSVLYREQQFSTGTNSATSGMGAGAQMMARAQTIRQAVAPPAALRSGNPFQAGTLLGGLLSRRS